jgi:hypothetical protein
VNRSLELVAPIILSTAIELTAAAPQAVQLPPEYQPVITVHVYNYAQIPAWRLARTQKRVEGFFLDAGIRLRWKNIALPSGKARRTTEPAWSPVPSDLVLKIVSGFPKDADQFREPVFGFAAGHQVSIFNKRTEDVAINADVTQPEILAIAIAHELGHALLGPNSHSDTGIMRPRMQPRDFRKAQCRTLAFTPEQAQRMRSRIVLLIAGENR